MFNNKSTIAPPPNDTLKGIKQAKSLTAKRLRGIDAKRQSLIQAAKQLRSEAAKFFNVREFVDILSLVKRNILLSPLEGEKKFLSELCELRNFREGYKKYKNSDRATECAMTDVDDKKGK